MFLLNSSVFFTYTTHTNHKYDTGVRGKFSKGGPAWVAFCSFIKHRAFFPHTGGHTPQIAVFFGLFLLLLYCYTSDIFYNMKTRLITGFVFALALALGACNDELDNLAPDKKIDKALATDGEGMIESDIDEID